MNNLYYIVALNSVDFDEENEFVRAEDYPMICGAYPDTKSAMLSVEEYDYHGIGNKFRFILVIENPGESFAFLCQQLEQGMNAEYVMAIYGWHEAVGYCRLYPKPERSGE